VDAISIEIGHTERASEITRQGPGAYLLQSVGLPRGSACDGWLSGSRSGEPAAAPERNALSADPIVEIQSLWLTGLSD